MSIKISNIEVSLAVIERMARAATAGQIEINRFDEPDGSIQYQLQLNGNGEDSTVLGYAHDGDGNTRAKRDAELWAIAREAILALVQRVRTAEHSLAHVEHQAQMRKEDREAWYPVTTPAHERIRDAVYEWGRTDTRGTTPFRELARSQMDALVSAMCKAFDEESKR